MTDLADFTIELLLMIGSAFLASFLTYVFSIRQSAKERVVIERIRLYKPLIEFINDLPGPHEKAEWQQMEKRVNALYNELLLFAPDDVIRAFLDAMSTVRKGASAAPMIEFMVTLRREILGKTDITPDSYVSIEFRP